MEAEIRVTDEQLEILNTGRAFASLEQSSAYKALISWIEGFEKVANQECQQILKSGASNDAYQRMSIRRDTAIELREMIQGKITEIKDYASQIAVEIRENNS